MPVIPLLSFGLALIVAALATPLVIRLARFVGAIDIPDGVRKHHRRPTPLFGGLAVATGLVAAGVTVFFASSGARFSDSIVPVSALVALACSVLVGIVDEIHGLRASQKLVCQTMVAGMFYAAGFQLVNLSLFGMRVELGPLSFAVTCAWFVVCMNIWNLIDGLDGLAAGCGALAAAALGLLSVIHGSAAWSAPALGLAGALIGFLVFNFAPAKIFLGETGTMVIASALAALSIAGQEAAAETSLVGPILCMGLPLLDTLLAVGRRWMREVTWYEADHAHVHHQLLRLDLGDRQVALVCWGITLILATIAVLGALWGYPLAVGLALTFGISAAAPLANLVPMNRLRGTVKERTQAAVQNVTDRVYRRVREQDVARAVWKAVDRIEHGRSTRAVLEVLDSLSRQLGCHSVSVRYERDGEPLIEDQFGAADAVDGPQLEQRLSLSDWPGERLLLVFHAGSAGSGLVLATRFLPRLCQELLPRLRSLSAEEFSSPAIETKPGEESILDESAAQEEVFAQLGDELAPAPWSDDAQRAA